MTFLLIVLRIGQIQFRYFNGYVQQRESRMYLSATEQLEFWKHIKGELNPSDIWTREKPLRSYPRAIDYLDQLG